MLQIKKQRNKANVFHDCPFCKHFDHFVINDEKNKFISFSNCVKNGSIVDFIMQYENLNKADAINKVIKIAGLEHYKETKVNTTTRDKVIKANETIKDADNFNDLIEKLHTNVGQTDYFNKRGLTAKTINKYKLGYAEEGLNYAIRESLLLKEKEQDLYKAYKYFLPMWSNDNNCRYFITRLDDNALTESSGKLNKTHNLKGFSAKLFNDRYLEDTELTDNLIFIVEGIFDALSLEEIDLEAIALNSTSNAELFINKLKENIDDIKKKTFILIPDSDKAGNNLSTKLINSFKEMGLHLEICNLPEEYKDVNEFLQDNRERFSSYITNFIKSFKSLNYNNIYLDKFLDELKLSKSNEVISTGFAGLDSLLGGGLYSGLYTIGAISSLGKTTLVLQMADYIAQKGVDVIYISLEMGRNELIRKSLSREMFFINHKDAVTARDIMRGSYNDELFSTAFNKYRDISQNISIIEGDFKVGVNEIRELVRKNIDIRQKKPVVIVDYFQILKSPDNRINEKQACDYNISELKRISRDFDIPIIAISSFNRTNYTSAVGYESFKESGAIEYSSDVIIGLQLKGIEVIADSKSETEKRNKTNDLKSKYPREIELITIKQRDGVAYAKQVFQYYAKYNYFLEVREISFENRYS